MNLRERSNASTTSPPIGVGIIGLGRIGALHADHLMNAIRGARLVRAAVDPAHKKKLEAEGYPIPLTDDPAALINDPEVEAVVIASPSTFHYEHIVLVTEARKPLFCEKPLADNVPDAMKAADKIRTSGIPFQIGFQRRFDRGYKRARQLIEQGCIGVPELFKGVTCDRIPSVDYLKTSGGLFWDLGVHDFDAARFLTGLEIESVYAHGAVLVDKQLEEIDDVDYGLVILRFSSGAMGGVHNAWRAPWGYEIRAEVYGSKGKVVTELDEKFPTRLYDQRGIVIDRHTLFTERFRDAYRDEIQAFVDAILAGKIPSPGVDDAVKALLVADAATRSRKSRDWVQIPL